MDEFEYGLGEPTVDAFGIEDGLGAFDVNNEETPVDTLDATDAPADIPTEEPVATEEAADTGADADAGFGWGIDGIDGVDGEAAQEDVFGLADTAEEHRSAFIAQPEAENTDLYAKWEKNRQKVLAERLESQRAEKQAAIADAKKQLDEFLAKREANISKTKSINRSEEKQWKSELATTNASGTDWEKVAKYCDLKPKSEAKTAQSKNERMRKLLVGLKTEGLSK